MKGIDKGKTCYSNAASPASRDLCNMHSVDWRGRCRGVYFKDHVLSYVFGFAERTGSSFSSVVNFLLEKAFCDGLGEVEEGLRLEVRREQLLAEERSLRERLKVILRSGAYLRDYVEKLLLGDSEQISNRKIRIGIFAHVDAKELNVVLRILKRREDLVAELIEIEDQLLPEEPYSFMVTEGGWKLGDSIYSRDRFRCLNPTNKTGQSKQQTGGEKQT